ncbi:MAG: 50S ribosomal protein L18, partial [Elusimicrobia bacterium]|nr:50S ribosomal protein L18 [Elusimicrobiota bacterium]MBD3412092.1 50S ribosomal protein L18 [Elusimicrobiota bacterium]
MRDTKTRHRIRKLKTRKKIFGTAERPRLTVFRSLKHIYAQVIDDHAGRVIVADSTVHKDSAERNNGGTVAAADKVGQRIAQKAIAQGVK